MSRHSVPRQVPGWLLAFVGLTAAALVTLWAVGSGGGDNSPDPDPPGSRVPTQTVAPTVTETVEKTRPGPTVTETVKVKITEKAKPAPTVTRTETRTAAPKTVPGPTVTKTVPGPTVTRTATVTAPAPLPPNSGGGGVTIVEAPNGRGCMEMEIINGVVTYGPPFPC